MALLNLKKVQKALGDAEKACELRPDWEKAHFRRGRALEELERWEEALAAYAHSAELEATPECREKVKNLRKLLQKAEKAPPRPEGVRNDEDYRTAQRQMADEIGAGHEVDYSSDRALAFAREVMGEAVEALRRGEEVAPAVHFLPGWRGDGGEEKKGVVSVKAAFASPDTVRQVTEFLRQYAADYRAHAAVLVCPRRDIAYPQVWKQKGWTHGLTHGLFVQLESEGARRVWFVPVPKGRVPEEPVLLEDTDKWMVMMRLFK